MSEPLPDSGRYIILLREGCETEGLKEIDNIFAKHVRSEDFGARGGVAAQVDGNRPFYLTKTSSVIVKSDPDQFRRIRAKLKKQGPFVDALPDYPMEPTMAMPRWALDYLNGYKDAVNHIYSTISEATLKAGSLEKDFSPRYEASYAWGLEETSVVRSSFTGRGVKVAVLDSGIRENHPDFLNRVADKASFVSDDGDVQDRYGHGTHCIGIALGPKVPVNQLARYGCAPGADIVVGKVLSDDGRGWISNVIEGIEWAIGKGCRIVSLSLGMSRQIRDGGRYELTFETIAKRALAGNPGTLIVAATGNSGNGKPPLLPACCESVLAVGAIDKDLSLAEFSNDQADILAPGVGIFSSLPNPSTLPLDQSKRGELHGYLDGTSMAAAYVSGIAALWLEALSTRTEEPVTARALFNRLTDSVIKTNIIQAPLS
jgi:subtilisin